MYILNQGFHNFHNNKVNMYVWNETIASRGSQEVASCCLKHLQNVTTRKHIIAYSDMCTGQNRNIKLVNIDHKFLLSRHHSYQTNAILQWYKRRKIRKTNSLYIPQDYYKAIRHIVENEFLLHEMKCKNFFSTQPLEESV